MNNNNHTRREDILMSLDQLDQTIEVLSIVIKKLKYNLEDLTRDELASDVTTHTFNKKIDWH